MKLYYLFLLFFLSSCLENNTSKLNTQEKECFHIISSKNFSRHIKLNKCTGESWILVRTTTEKGKDGKMTAYTERWYPISVELLEAELINK
jgi:hypothetical protein